uniref:ATP synthase F0 subunit 8 n=1 Tax=Darthula hardwickii TaxID=1264638 RepID=A0A0U1Z5K7_9HEMI|nr:ATP synthase F0 subunit 8 [Darthula hardwickii]AFY16796.1 ATP synthase F0 subunit 8 [Darthula hardwickii]AJP09350.1 ATP synthase F0 subunit 8 [Darthula hardwickii]
MPQMSPMWWLIMMMMFNYMLLMTNTLMYFNKNMKILKYTHNNTLMKWKW